MTLADQVEFDIAEFYQHFDDFIKTILIEPLKEKIKEASDQDFLPVSDVFVVSF